jgi:ligand-binding sensor domain-containing protein
LLQGTFLFGQDYRIENITSEYIRIEKGLSQNTVNTILQDQEGFLWVGTWSGLNRFDGYTFKTFTPNHLNPTKGLVQANIIGLAEDKRGNIWAASPKGLARISKHDFSITQFTTETHLQAGLVCDSINTLFSDSKGSIWIGTTCGAFVLDPDSLNFTHYEFNPRNNETISSNNITAFAEDTAGSIWIGTTNGLNKLNQASGRIIRYYAGTGTDDLASSVINCLIADPASNIWIGTPIGLCNYRSLSKSFRFFPIEKDPSGSSVTTKNFISCLYLDNKGSLWVGTRENGLQQFDKSSKKFINLQSKIPESDYFSFNSFWTIIQDRNGLYWLGTSHKGLVKLVPDPHAFYSIVPSYSVYGVIEPAPGNYWFGTQEGVLMYNRQTRAMKLLQYSDKNPASISSNLITGLFNDPPYVWITTRSGLNRYHVQQKTNRIFRPSGDPNSVAGDLFWHVSKDSKGDYWFSTNRGVSKWDPKTDRITNFQHNPDNPNSLSNNYCLHIIEAEPGIMLISTQHGLNEYNTLTNEWKVYMSDPKNITSIGSDYVFGVFRDHQGELWVYTNGGGLCQFDRQSGTFERYTNLDGLTDNIVYGMSQDREGIFWIITNNGLSRFDPKDGQFNNFDVQDGLFSNEFNINSILETTSGEILLGGVNGVNAFLPQTTIRTSKTPVARITQFICHGDTASFDLPIADTIRIKSLDNTFSISFSLLDYLNPFKNQFKYYLDNFDRDRTTLPPGFYQVDYRRVPPGHYTFHVSGTNSLGITSEETTLSIIIIPAWYQTFLFKFLVVFMALAIVGSFILLRLNSLRNRHEIEKQLLTTQAELIRSQKFALRSQMNPHFIFNSLNSIQNFVLKNDVDSANYYLSNFSILMRKVLEYSQYNFITLAEELEMIQLYLKMEKMRFSRKFEVEIKVSTDIDQHMVRIPPMLLQPYLENAILHGLQLIKHKGLLQVLVEDHEDFMSILIIDNGIGREKARSIRERTGHKSKGLANIEKRIQLYNKISEKHLAVNIIDLFDNNGEPAGTRVEIRVPYDMEEQSKEIL